MTGVDQPYRLAEGDLVWVWEGGRLQRQQTVQKIGRTLVHIGPEPTWTRAYRIATRQRNDGNPGYFMTQEQKDALHLRERAMLVLRAHGVEISPRVEWDTDQLTQLAGFLPRIHPIPEDVEGRR